MIAQKILLALLTVTVSGCVGGGSLLKTRAKKEAGVVSISVGLHAFGGANLRKFDTCLVEYKSSGSNKAQSLFFPEILREAEHVEWKSTLKNLGESGTLKVHTKVFDSSDENRQYSQTWIFNLKELSHEYRNIAPE